MSEGGYAWEKLHTAVLTLAQGTGSLRERLEDAYISSLMRLRPDHHFPWSDLRQRYTDLTEEIAPGGDFRTALARWSDYDLQRIFGDLVGVYDAVARRRGDG